MRFCYLYLESENNEAPITIVKGQITACGFVTMYYHIVTRGVVEVKGQITACGFVTVKNLKPGL